MSNFSIFNAKVLVSAAIAFLPMALLFTALEVTTQDVVRQAQAGQVQHIQALAHGMGSSTHGVVVG